MIWLTLRQQRLELLICAAILALLGVLLLLTGLDMAATYQRLGVAACLTSHSFACGDTIDAFRTQFSALTGLVNWLALLPLVFGVLLAAPFVQEIEQGTYRLAWTQSITRTRWITVKLGLLVGTALLVGALLTGVVTWWRTPFDHLDGAFQPNTFDLEGIVPLAYTVFAVALVLGIGTLLRRTVPAIGISLICFIALRLGIEGWPRPTYMPPLTTTTGSIQRADWVFNVGFADRQGHPVQFFDVMRICGVEHGRELGITPACLLQHGIVNIVTYQPADRFWTFQGIESGIFLGLAVVLLAITVWTVLRRMA
jgi:hypothetical protein